MSLAELGGESFVVLTDTPWLPMRTILDRLFDEAGVERRIACEVDDMHRLLDFVAQGLGVALVPQQDAVHDDRVCSIPLQAPTVELDVVVATAEHPTASAAARALLALISPPATA